MKSLNKILIATAFFSLSVAFCVCAEETKATETAPGVVSENVTAAPAVVPAAATASAAAAPEVPIVPPLPVEKTTLENLQAAFNGESNAHTRYLAFAQQADAEGYKKVAGLFRAAARAEQIHFERHAKLIKELGGTPAANIETPVVKSTTENLGAAMKGEIYESTIMYPEFLARAQRDQNKGAIDVFADAERAEAVHAELYKKALENLNTWKAGGKNFYVCPVCGNVMEDMKYKNCPICNTHRREYITVT